MQYNGRSRMFGLLGPGKRQRGVDMHDPICKISPDFRVLFESAPGLYLVLTTDLEIIAVSDAYLQATMTKRKDIMGRTLFEIFPDNPDDASATGVRNLKASLDRVIANKVADTMAVQKYDIRKPQSEGSGFEVRYWSPVNSPVLNKAGEIEYIIHRVEDVTEFIKLRQASSKHKQENEELKSRTSHMEVEIYMRVHELAEARLKVEETNHALKNSHRYLKDLLNHVVDPIFVKDRYHRWIDGNTAFWEMMGQPREAVIGRSDYDFFPKEEADIFWQKDDEVFNSNKININIENFTDTSGKLHIISTKKACFRVGNSEPVLVGIIRDITEVTRMQEQLNDISRATARLLASIVESSEDAIISRTLGGIIMSWNDAAMRLYGYSVQEAIGHHINLIIPPEKVDEEGNFFSLVNEDIRVKRFETVRLHKDGSRIDVSLTVSPIRDAAGNLIGISKIAHDITSQKRIEAQLKSSLEDVSRAKQIAEDAQQKAEIANIAKSQFLANMSHEIRTPLNSMIGLTELLLDTELSSQQENHLRTVLKSGETLVGLISDMLDFSKIEAGKLELEQAPFELQAAVEDTAELFAPKAREKEQHVELLVNFSPDIPRYLVGDIIRIRQILSNLLNNAIKFTYNGYVLLSVVPVPVASPANTIAIELSVSDTGIGIEADKLKIIFDKFSQADISTTRKFGGTGLGLTISRQLCNMMGGDIVVQSTPGKGSTFTATVVLKHPQGTIGTGAFSADLSLLSGKRALIVDDVEPSCTILSAQLASAGIISVSAYDIGSALKILAEANDTGESFDILIADYVFPEMGSVAFTEKARALCPTIALVIVTAFVDHGYAQMFASSGCDAYLTKPVRKEQLLAILKALFSARACGKNLSMLSPLSVVTKKTEPAADATDKQYIEGAKILLVEDNRANRDLGVNLLKNFGCRAIVALNGEEALEMVKKQPFDLILMDCQMPEMDGYEASTILNAMKKRKEIHDIPIIALTANAMAGDREKCLESGMNAYLTKPLRKIAMRDVLLNWLPPKEKRVAA